MSADLERERGFLTCTHVTRESLRAHVERTGMHDQCWTRRIGCDIAATAGGEQQEGECACEDDCGADGWTCMCDSLVVLEALS